MKKKVLVTGGTGFLGRSLGLSLRDEYDVVLTGRNNKQNMYAQQVTGCNVLPLDVTSIESVRDCLVETKPQIVLGSQNVARVSIEKNVETVIGISTDKAAPPVRNTYGLSKAMMERVFCAMNGKSETRFACVRYGNVAWSTGSVLPIWKRMHDETGVIRSTGPEMRRFFFTVDEAVKLVRTAMDNMETIAGKVLSRRMKSAQISDLLTTWTKNKGGSWERMEGRPGERDDEFLIGDIELPFTHEVEYDGITHYIIAFNEKAATPLAVGLSSANTERLSESEMLALINSPAE